LLTRSSLPNLFSLCGRALQVDGNLGATAAIAEMLVQSHQESIHLLPALPAEWGTGSVVGLRARGGFMVDLRWAEGRLTEAHLQSSQRRRAVVAARGVTGVTAGGRRVRFQRVGPDTIAFPAETGVRYRIEFRV
jgi:alpha-L-fucosidase 2